MFDLHNLGWKSFQQLCLTITREVLGQTVESFLDSRDAGRDGAFAGVWKPTGFESLSGQFVIQCKFSSKPNQALRKSDISDELQKVRRLVAAGICDSYLLMTNAALSGTREQEMKALFGDAGVQHVIILGSTWINQQIRDNTRLRMLVPRVYGLGDLSQILDERAYVQAKAILESMREDLAKVVVTSAYRRAVDAINRYSYVMLIGEPAAGKTTVASLLAMAAIDQWGASTLKIDEPGSMAERWNPDEPSQFFWIDDVFGVTQYEDSLVHRWNHLLPQIGPMLRRGAKIVMTSRDYIYNRARRDLKESAFPLMKESQVVIDVHELSIDEKRQILYNHLKLGGQPRAFRTKVKPFLEGVASHDRFIPETARRLADPLFTRSLADPSATRSFLIDGYRIGEFVERREQFLREVLQGLDADSKAALALIYMRKGSLESPIDLEPSEREALERLRSDLGGCVTALESLKGSLVVHTLSGDSPAWKFKHPTVGDAYSEILVESPEHLGIFIRGSAPERLIGQVTCGDVGIEKAVVVPKSLFPLMLEKLSEFSRSQAYKSDSLSTFGAMRDLQGFLARRCSRDSLLAYLQRNADLLERVSKPGLFLHAVPEVRLAKRLHEFGLLPEPIRRRFVETVGNYALEGRDADALDDAEVRALFTDSEHEDLVQRVRSEVIPRLAEIRSEWEIDYRGGDSSEEHMHQLLAFFSSLTACFGADDEAVLLTEQEIQRTKEWIYEHAAEETEPRSRDLGKVEISEELEAQRSVFDDIDAAEE